MRKGPHDLHLVMSQEETTPVPPGICDRRCTRPLGVIGLAMRRHSLKVHSSLGSRPTRHAATLPHGTGAVCTVQPVHYSSHSVSPARDGSVDRSQLVASSRGAPRPLGVAGLAMRRLSFAELVRFSCSGGVTGGNPVRRVPHEKVTTDGVKTSRVRGLSAPCYREPCNFSEPASAGGEKIACPVPNHPTAQGGHLWGGWAPARLQPIPSQVQVL